MAQTSSLKTLCSIIFFLLVQNLGISAFPKPIRKELHDVNSTAINFDFDQPLEKSISFTEESQRVYRKAEKFLDGCPKPVSNLQRFDKKSRKCSQIGSKSHCGKNMIFYSYKDSEIYGQCDCDYNAPVPLIYHKKTDRCYFMYQQGTCKDREWLEINSKTGKPFCSTNKCSELGRTGFGSLPLASRDTVPEYVPLGSSGECVKLNEPNNKCSKNEVVSFKRPTELYASCIALEVQLKHLSPGSTLQCPPGHYLSVLGTCHFAFDFD